MLIFCKDKLNILLCLRSDLLYSKSCNFLLKTKSLTQKGYLDHYPLIEHTNFTGKKVNCGERYYMFQAINAKSKVFYPLTYFFTCYNASKLPNITTVLFTSFYNSLWNWLAFRKLAQKTNTRRLVYEAPSKIYRNN